MILRSPHERAEAALLGRILLNEEDRAAGRASGPRLLEQVRRWGITSGGLFGHTYHREVWHRVQDLAAEGDHVTRLTLAQHLADAVDPEKTTDPASAPHPDVARPANLVHLTDAADATTTGTDRCAGMVVSAAMHRSVHDMAIDLAHASAGETGAVATTVDKAKAKLRRMRQAWERLPGAARADLRALATPPRPPTPLAQAQAELAEARSWMTELRQDPAYAAQMAAEPAWRIVDRLMGVVDALANTSIDAPHSPDPGARTFLAPGEMMPDAAVTVEERQAHAADQVENDHGQAVPDAEREEPVAMVDPNADEIAFADFEARRADPERQVQRDDREARLLGSLVADPSQLDEIDLAPKGFSPERRQTAELIAGMHQAGATIDPLTLDWAAQVHGTTIPPEAIGEPLFPGEARSGLADRVHQDHAETRVESAIDELRQLGIDPAVPPEDLIPRAETALEEVGIDPPELEPVLGDAHRPEAERDPEPETAAVPPARTPDEPQPAHELETSS